MNFGSSISLSLCVEFTMQTKIITERLLLNIPTEGDYEFIHELVNTKGWLQFIGDRNIHSKEAAIAYIDKIKGMPNFYYWWFG